MPSKFTCPRRAENGMTDPNLDEFAAGHGLSGQQRGCTYCGSMSAEDFMEAVRSKAVIGPTDKSYKLYVGDYQGKFYTAHLSDEQGHEFWSLIQGAKVNWGYPGYNYVPLFIPGPSTTPTSERNPS